MSYKDGRHTACISSQAGCAMGCVFCATGRGRDRVKVKVKVRVRVRVKAVPWVACSAPQVCLKGK